MLSSPVLESLIEELMHLPGIGAKSAERLAYHLLKQPAPRALALAEAIRRLKEELRDCSRCHNICEGELCSICQDSSRNMQQICVVEHPKDLMIIEQSGAFQGLYHVLGGNFSPMENRGPESLNLEHLLKRVVEEEIEEVVMATNPDYDGDGTAMLIVESLQSLAQAISATESSATESASAETSTKSPDLKPFNLKISRLARGIPTGGQLEYMNRSIISDAMTGRQQFDQ